MRNGPYELVLAPEKYPGKKYRGKYCYEHHLVYWQHTGKIPKPGEHVHHKNHKKRDNRFENLELLSEIEHQKHHGVERHLKSRITFACGWCGKKSVTGRRSYNARIKLRPKLFCSASCGAKNQHSSVP